METLSGWCLFVEKHRLKVFLSVSAIFVLIATLVVVFVGGHAFAQNTVDTSSVDLSRMSVDWATKGRDSNQFVANIQMSIDNRAPVAATIESTDLDLIYENKKIADIFLPSLSLRASALSNFKLKQVLINVGSNIDSWNSFATELLAHDTVTLRMQGSVKAKALGLSFTVTLDKASVLQGLNNFQDEGAIAIQSNAILSTDANSVSLLLNTTMDNPSSVSMSNLGRLSFSVFYNGTQVGTLKSLNGVSLVSGANQVPILAQIVQDARDASNYDAIDRLMSSYANGDQLTLEMRHGSSDVRLLNGPLSSLSISVSFNGLLTAEASNIPANKAKLNTSNANMSDPIQMQAFNTLSATLSTLPACDGSSCPVAERKLLLAAYAPLNANGKHSIFLRGYFERLQVSTWFCVI